PWSRRRMTRCAAFAAQPAPWISCKKPRPNGRVYRLACSSLLGRLQRFGPSMGTVERSSQHPASALGGEPTDNALLEHFITGRSEAAFAALVQRYGAVVYGVCTRVLRHAQDAEDAAQATFLVLARKAGSIRSGTSLGGWLYRVAFRIAIHAKRRKV